MAQDNKSKYQAKPAPAPAEALVAEVVETAAVEAPAVEAPVVETPAAAPKVGVNVRSKVGTMVHPFKGITFQGEKPLELASIDSWTQSQIDAGKLEVVE